MLKSKKTRGALGALFLLALMGTMTLSFQNCGQLNGPADSGSNGAGSLSVPTPTPTPALSPDPSAKPGASPGPTPAPAPPQMSVGNVSMVVGTTVTVQLTFTGIDRSYTINWSLPTGSPFAARSGSVNISAGQTQASLSITSTAALGSGNATYNLTLSESSLALAQVVVTVNVTDPSPPPTLTLGPLNTCAAIGGVAKCWGNGAQDGTVGLNGSRNSNTPVAITGLPTGSVAQIAVGGGTYCAIVAGALYCWGDNSYGQLGNGTSVATTAPSTTAVVGMDSGVSSVSIANGHICAIKSGGLYCWGLNNYGQLGLGATDYTNRSVATVVPGLTANVTMIASGSLHTCAIVSGGVKCWGYNGYGQLGDGTATTRPVPTDVPGVGTGATSVAVGDNHSCAVAGTSLKCWGYNGYGQLGDGSVQQKLAAATVTFTSGNPVQVTAGQNHTCAVVGTGAMCWGYNGYGQLGDGTNANRMSPVVVGGLTSGVTVISTGGGANHSCAVVNKTSVKCWWRGDYGQIGNGANLSVNAATAVTF